ncbi:MAG: GNAT family N-acetyltransferase [Thermoplasmata archaeon]
MASAASRRGLRPAQRGRGRSTQVRRARQGDLEAIARIGSASFSGLRPSARGLRWIRNNWAGRPRMRYWIARRGGKLVAYILWIEKGGFRLDAVVELEQIAVDPGLRGKGIGSVLVRRSLRQLHEEIGRSGRRVKVIEVTTGSEQGAIGFYRRALGAKVVAKIPNLFRGNEYILIARPRTRARR